MPCIKLKKVHVFLYAFFGAEAHFRAVCTGASYAKNNDRHRGLIIAAVQILSSFGPVTHGALPRSYDGNLVLALPSVQMAC